MKKQKVMLLCAAIFTISVVSLSWKVRSSKLNVSPISKTQTSSMKKKPNYDYDRGYNKGYSMGSMGYVALFKSDYSRAMDADQFDFADGLLDGYNAGTSGGSSSSGGGPATSIDPTTGCKFVINDAGLAAYLNGLGFGCYVNLN